MTLSWSIRSRLDFAFASPWAWPLTLSGALLCMTIAALTQGVVNLSPADLARSLLDSRDPLHRLVWDVRLPRIVCAITVGASLAVAGLLLQTTVRNPLADPGILGVTAGAGVGALLVLLLSPENASLMPFAALAGGLAAIGIVLLLSWQRAGRASPLRVVLSGVALQAMLFAVIALLTFIYADRAPSFVAFTVGSLNGSAWASLQLIALPFATGMVASFIVLRPLDLLLLEDGVAQSVGLPVRLARSTAACIAALLTAGAVSVAGLVGFVGLVVPNGMRLIVGPTHRRLFPVCALGGAALVLVADLLSRTVLAPIELPVGAFMALLGGPYFLFLLWKKIP